MDEATQQNAALVEEASASARALEEQAGQLADAVAAFKLSDAATTSTRRAHPAAAPRPASKPAALSAVRSAPIAVATGTELREF
jgi:methyl-accepting chemotaxis protein